jgi:hypothetical protein
MRRLVLAIAVVCLSLSAFAADPSILPANFAGWQKVPAVKHGEDPAQVDSAYPGVLKEYGFHDYEIADYSREGRKITVKAARFDSVTGSYGAFTFYRTPDMPEERIGDGAVDGHNRVLFFQSNLLLDVTLDQLTAMTAADLRELAKDLPKAQGNDATPPTVQSYLPKEKQVKGSVHFIRGPQALELVHAPINADQVNYAKFGTDAELAMADYADRDDHSTMVVISYPTNQIATERLQNFANTMQSSPGLVGKRTGNLVVLMTGSLPPDVEKGLVGSVNFDATVSWTEATVVAPKNNIGNLIVALFTLIGILLVVGLIFGVFMGGTRVLVQRFLPGRFHKEDEDEFISLDLR